MPWRIAAGRLLLRVRLTPKSSRDAVEGIEATSDGPALKARVRAVPEDGKANAALEALIANWLDVPRRSVVVVAGQTSRVKSVQIAGDAATLSARLAAALPRD
jgi:hypothetical protein